jgi:hypothetical protein
MKTYIFISCGKSLYNPSFDKVRAASKAEALCVFSAEKSTETGCTTQHFHDNFEAVEV